MARRPGPRASCTCSPRVADACATEEPGETRAVRSATSSLKALSCPQVVRSRYLVYSSHAVAIQGALSPVQIEPVRISNNCRAIRGLPTPPGGNIHWTVIRITLPRIMQQIKFFFIPFLPFLIRDASIPSKWAALYNLDLNVCEKMKSL